MRPERAATAGVRSPPPTAMPQESPPVASTVSLPSPACSVPTISTTPLSPDGKLANKPSVMQKPLVSRRIRYVRPRTAGHRRSHATADGDTSSSCLAQSTCMEEDFSEQALREVFPSSDSSSSSSEEPTSKDTAKIFPVAVVPNTTGITRPVYEELSVAASA
eukprot:EG_transcript_38336